MHLTSDVEAIPVEESSRHQCAHTSPKATACLKVHSPQGEVNSSQPQGSPEKWLKEFKARVSDLPKRDREALHNMLFQWIRRISSS